MNRIAPALALALLLTAGETAFALPETFTLTGADGRTGTLDLETETNAATISVQDGETTIRLSGKLKAKGQRLEASIRPGNGMANKLRGRRRAKPWKVVVLPQGLKVDVILTQGKRTLKLTGQTPLGKRHAGNEALIRAFYDAFKRADGATMSSVYAADARFSDPVFPDLRGERIGAMWRSLCESKPVVTYSGVQADARHGKAQWIAKYELFGRPITNVIQASFEFKDGKVIHHVDHFSFKTWGGQAYTKSLTFLAERPLLALTRLITARRLKKFMAKEAAAEAAATAEQATPQK